MSARNKKKRTARKDKSCPQNSNQKYSTFPSNNVVEVGEMATMDHDGTSGGLDSDCQRTDYLQVAWLLREKLNDLVDGDKGEFPGLELQSLLDMATSRNIICVDPKMLNPVLWRTLPKELLLLILARLPVPDITRLCCLSTEWRRDMANVNSEINQAVHEASPTMVALLAVNKKGFFVTIYDIQKSRWQYSYQLLLRSSWDNDWQWFPYSSTWTAVDACDGGLVCFVSLWRPTTRNRLLIVVVNLLTRVKHELPPLLCYSFDFPAMVQIEVDSHTKCYQVVVGSYGLRGVTIYDSSTRQWTYAMPPCGSIFGPVLKWNAMYNWHDRVLATTSLVVYDFVEGSMKVYDKDNHGEGESVIALVLEKDHMFVLQEQTQMDASHQRWIHHGCNIIEYHFKHQTKAWVQEKLYECPSQVKELPKEELLRLSLITCDGFLMVHHDWDNQYYWLLDLSTSKWSHIPKVTSIGLDPISQSLMCRASWKSSRASNA